MAYARTGGYGPTSPTEIARSRYANAFSSHIFDPLEPSSGRGFVPAGKRRDQTTSEMFGNDNDKDLHAMPKTFIPRDDDRTARQKKLQFLTSDVLPHTSYPQGMVPPPAGHLGEAMLHTGAHHNLGEEPGFQEDEPDVDPAMRRQWELCSELFGRETPGVQEQQLHDQSRRLTPSDFKWFNVPEPVHSPTEDAALTSHDRLYHEKCSGLFDRKSPIDQHRGWQAHQAQKDPEEMLEVKDGELKRKANVYYSDLFGRSTPMAEIPGKAERHPKHQSSVEEQVVVNQDWTDSKTELMRGAEIFKPETPAERRRDEFDKTRLFNPEGIDTSVPPGEPSMAPISTDNSGKLKQALGHATQTIHQAHLKSSLMDAGFYDTATSTRAWEVIELHIDGLPRDADENYVKKLCNGFDLQLVKVTVEMDPVRNLCKGRAKLMLRYNPQRDTIGGLVRSLEEKGSLRVDV